MNLGQDYHRSDVMPFSVCRFKSPDTNMTVTGEVDFDRLVIQCWPGFSSIKLLPFSL